MSLGTNHLENMCEGCIRMSTKNLVRLISGGHNEWLIIFLKHLANVGWENPQDLGSLRDQNTVVEKICRIWVHSETKIPRNRIYAGFRFSTLRPKPRGWEIPRDLSSLSDQNPAVNKICGIWVHSVTKIPRLRNSAGFGFTSRPSTPQDFTASITQLRCSIQVFVSN